MTAPIEDFLGMKLVSFGSTSVQKGRRVRLGESLLQNLGIQEGDQVELFLDTEEEAIVVKKAQTAPQGKERSRRARRRITPGLGGTQP